MAPSVLGGTIGTAMVTLVTPDTILRWQNSSDQVRARFTDLSTDVHQNQRRWSFREGCVSVVQPHGVADEVRRKAMPEVAGSSSLHPGIVPRGELT